MVGQLNPHLLLLIPLAPLVGALLSGLFGTRFFGNIIGRRASHSITILGVFIAFVLSCYTLKLVLDGATFNAALYQWSMIKGVAFEIGFLVDSLTAMMMCVVTFVSLMVHIYTVGYMADDASYSRFFSYISLFTFSMLMLVMSNNFLQLFFGWEAVGLVSYLLIGFWYTRSSAVFANMKAFMVNRVGDFGFILGIGLLLSATSSLNYAEIFAQKNTVAEFFLPGTSWNLLTVACICLFIGAMGKSAQFPLHVWLPDSMEGPTPISALIHAATMVTAGIFMVARMSPLFELSEAALSFILIIGAITALFMGFLAIIQNDIKRVVAYSTLSQLGYMTVALGASAYQVAVFHLMTHAFFKALLFLAAGAVIVSMHHDQDIRNMGGLRKYLPITWITFLLGSLALIGMPFFSGFYSKDSIIEAVQTSSLAGAGFAYFAVLASVFVTAFYTFRLYFLVFHGEERFGKTHDSHEIDDSSHHAHNLAVGKKPEEASWTILLPLVLLAIPSVLIGFLTIEPLLFGDFFKAAITVEDSHPAMHELRESFHGVVTMALDGFVSLPFWLALAGFVTAYYCYMINKKVPTWFYQSFHWLYKLLDNKYYLDRFNQFFFANGAVSLGTGLWKAIDKAIIDKIIVNGSAKSIGYLGKLVRLCQSGYIYHYVFVMILGVSGFLIYFMPFPSFVR